MTAPVDIDRLEAEVRGALEREEIEALRAMLAAAYPPDVADVIDRLDDDDQIRVFRLLALEQAADVLDETSLDATRELIGELTTDEAADLLEELDSDDAAAILTEDVPERQQALLDAMDPEDAADVRELLRYPPQSAGRLLNDYFVAVRPEMTAAQALDELRAVVHDTAVIVYLYVVEESSRLIGTLSLRNLLVAPPTQSVAELMRPNPLAVAPDTDQEEVARIVSRYDLAAVPVVRRDGRMLGVVTADDVIDILTEEGTEDVLRFGGVGDAHPDETYFTVPIRVAVRRRLPWLLLLFVGGSLTANVLGVFESELEKMVALTFYVPLLIGTGGNTGAQTVSTLIRALALGEVRLRDAWHVVGRELLAGLVLGLMLGAVAFGKVLLDGQIFALAGTVALSVVAICVWANIIGALVPMAARRFNTDPALVSAPMITTLVDASGLAIYLLIAGALLRL
jgi:magnesium transporter